MYLPKLRRVVQLVLLILVPAAAITTGGLAVHQDALLVGLGRELPQPGTADPAYIRVGIRNRLAVLLPVRGSRCSPGWLLERRTPSGKWQPIPAKSSPPATLEHLTWLFPFQRSTFRVAVDRPGTFRAVVFSGRRGLTRHEAVPVSFGLRDFDHPPDAH